MNKSTLKVITPEPENPKGHTGWAADDKERLCDKARPLKKPIMPKFKDATVKTEMPGNLKKRVAEINKRKKKQPDKLSFVMRLRKLLRP
jgi:hypothetical protein